MPEPLHPVAVAPAPTAPTFGGEDVASHPTRDADARHAAGGAPAGPRAPAALPPFDVLLGPLAEMVPPALASALATDTTDTLILLDDQLFVRGVNARAWRSLSKVADPPLGMHVSSIFPASVARDRMELLELALDSQKPVCVIGMLSGVWMSISYRPLTRPGTGARYVLVICPNSTGVKKHALEEPGVQVRRSRVDDAGPLSRLSAREVEILGWVARGFSSIEIAERLGRSAKTVDGHLFAIRRRLGSEASRVDLARLALDAGLHDVPREEITVMFRQLRPPDESVPDIRVPPPA